MQSHCIGLRNPVLLSNMFDRICRLSVVRTAQHHNGGLSVPLTDTLSLSKFYGLADSYIAADNFAFLQIR